MNKYKVKVRVVIENEFEVGSDCYPEGLNVDGICKIEKENIEKDLFMYIDMLLEKGKLSDDLNVDIEVTDNESGEKASSVVN